MRQGRTWAAGRMRRLGQIGPMEQVGGQVPGHQAGQEVQVGQGGLLQPMQVELEEYLDLPPVALDLHNCMYIAFHRLQNAR